ncbi:hypothetical protein MLD38_016437 [Melastoma candidum]|uniref:Uncharacterized protein n=1 Tax=Melastoma candidum TaxID=119954 RepID=A0ACB9RJ94_9MYRT|nr:hypothetical protein MLD38_016437 [Melastoma candidum]
MGCVFSRGGSYPCNVSWVKKPGEGANGASAATEIGSKGRVKQLKDKVAREEKIASGDGNMDVNGTSRSKPRPGNLPRQWRGEQVAAGWPSWLSEACGEALNGWIPRQANAFEKIDKIGQGTYSNVYKAKDMLTGKIVALKKVRFDNLESESVRFMAREILILRRLDHPNVVKLEGLVTSRMSCSLYLVFEYMEHDLAGLAATPLIKFSQAQVKCYMRQLLSGLEHCHGCHVLHRDIKGSNLLIDNEGILKLADFGLASFFDPANKRPMTSRVVTLWYRAPELLLGSTEYGVGIDMWSAGCILAELFAGRPILPGRTEVEQLHKIYKLCGTLDDGYWKKFKLPKTTLYMPKEPYQRCVRSKFKDFPSSALPLIDALLSIDPEERGTAAAALQSEFFSTEPYACEPSSLPRYPPSKEIDARRRDNEARRLRAASRVQGDNKKKLRTHDRAVRAIPAPEANAEVQANIDRRRQIIYNTNPKGTSEKFPPPHRDGAVGTLDNLDPTIHPPNNPHSSTSLTFSKNLSDLWSGPLAENSPDAALKRKKKKEKKKNAASGESDGIRGSLGSSVFALGTFKGKINGNGCVKEIRSFA